MSAACAAACALIARMSAARAEEDYHWSTVIGACPTAAAKGDWAVLAERSVAAVRAAHRGLLPVRLASHLAQAAVDALPAVFAAVLGEGLGAGHPPACCVEAAAAVAETLSSVVWENSGALASASLATDAVGNIAKCSERMALSGNSPLAARWAVPLAAAVEVTRGLAHRWRAEMRLQARSHAGQGNQAAAAIGAQRGWESTAQALLRGCVHLVSAAARVCVVAGGAPCRRQVGTAALLGILHSNLLAEAGATAEASEGNQARALRPADAVNAALGDVPESPEGAAEGLTAAGALYAAACGLPGRGDTQRAAWAALSHAVAAEPLRLGSKALAIMLRRSAERSVKGNPAVLPCATEAIWATIYALSAHDLTATSPPLVDATQLAPLLFQHCRWLVAAVGPRLVADPSRSEATPGGAPAAARIHATRLAEAGARIGSSVLAILTMPFGHPRDALALQAALSAIARAADSDGAALSGGLGLDRAAEFVLAVAFAGCTARKEVEDLEAARPQCATPPAHATQGPEQAAALPGESAPSDADADDDGDVDSDDDGSSSAARSDGPSGAAGGSLAGHQPEGRQSSSLTGQARRHAQSPASSLATR